MNQPHSLKPPSPVVQFLATTRLALSEKMIEDWRRADPELTKRLPDPAILKQASASSAIAPTFVDPETFTLIVTSYQKHVRLPPRWQYDPESLLFLNLAFPISANAVTLSKPEKTTEFAATKFTVKSTQDKHAPKRPERRFDPTNTRQKYKVRINRERTCELSLIQCRILEELTAGRYWAWINDDMFKQGDRFINQVNDKLYPPISLELLLKQIHYLRHGSQKLDLLLKPTQPGQIHLREGTICEFGDDYRQAIEQMRMNKEQGLNPASPMVPTG